MPWDPAIAGKGPAEPALPRVRGDQTSRPRCDDEGFQGDGTRIVADGLVEQLQDGDKCGCAGDAVQVAQAEHHADAEEPGGHEADPDGAHDGDGDHLLRSAHLLGEMGGAV